MSKLFASRQAASAAVLVLLSIAAVFPASADPLPTTVGPWNDYYTRPEMCVHAPDGVTSMACDIVMFSCMKESAGSSEAVEGSKEDKDRIERACWNKGMQDYLDRRNRPKPERKAEADDQGCNAQSKDEETAIAACTALIQSGDASPAKLSRAYFWRGASYDSKGDRHQALQDFSDSIRLNPRQRDAYNYLGMLYLDGNRFYGAIVNANDAIKNDPANGKAYWERGVGYLKTGEADKALPDFEMAVKLAPNDPDNWEALGITKKKLGREKEGERDIAKSRTLKPIHTVFR
jgi:tetratricopeptide (TPR) repeat protein